MAIEVTVGICFKETSQALFIQESEWEITLTKLRQIIEEQELHVPLEYKFKSLKGNAIGHPAEENIILKDIVSFIPSPKEDIKPNVEDLEMTSEGEAIKKMPDCPQIWIIPLKVTFSNSGPHSAGATDEHSDSVPRDGEEQNAPTGAGQQTPGGRCSSCPYTIFMSFIHGQRAPPSPKTLLKVLFLLTFLLFAMMASLTLTLHVMIRTFTDIGKSDMFTDVFSKLDGGSSEAVANLQVKFSQLEMSSKYEIDDLKSKMAELEDLYLRDLAVHKKELNIIKRQMAAEEGKDESFMVDEDEMEDFGDSRYNERNNKGFDKKSRRKAAGEGGERNKG